MIDKHKILEGLIGELVRVVDIGVFAPMFNADEVLEEDGIVGKMDFDGVRYFVLDEDEDPAVKVVARKFHIENVVLVYNGIYQPIIVLHK